ncbi:hypothetical protein HPB51_021041 [Rhipicephalus microplus]|uniref:DDE-1 domain-containing protein n=1 Tax=Rhipicephalus microplus TaxID=6941 RepID=A0A9J6DCB0_RHIMP|nr:hypothetical protein HPB51_021041 [Rhipicephalus microplus]
MLAVTADSRKLPPCVFFKRNTMQKANFPAGIHMRSQGKVWMSADLMVEWVQTVWGRRPGTLLLPSLLVPGSFRSHLRENVRQKIEELRTEIAIIPGGLTLVLQPLDVCIKKPFKDGVRCLYTEWMPHRGHALTPTGKIRRPFVELVFSWILDSWHLLPGDLITKSFTKTGIANSQDGSINDQLWDQDVEVASDRDDGISNSGENLSN